MIAGCPGIELGSPDRFGYEWKTYCELRPEYEEQFRRWTLQISSEDWAGKTFLDVGCGMGRTATGRSLVRRQNRRSDRCRPELACVGAKNA